MPIVWKKGTYEVCVSEEEISKRRFLAFVNGEMVCYGKDWAELGMHIKKENEEFWEELLKDGKVKDDGQLETN